MNKENIMQKMITAIIARIVPIKDPISAPIMMFKNAKSDETNADVEVGGIWTRDTDVFMTSCKLDILIL